MNAQLYKKTIVLFTCFLFLFLSNIYAQNVGIGTSKPLVPLHIKGNDEVLRIQGSFPWIGLTDNTSDSLTYDGFVYFPDTSLVLGTRFGTNMPVILAPNNTGVLYTTSAGNTGIGTPSPTQKLDVNGTVRIRGGSPAAGAVLTSDASGNATWQAAAAGSSLVDTISEPSANWLWNSQYSLETGPGSFTEYFTRYVDVPIAQITPAILMSGTVQVYFNPNPLSSTAAWVPLPYRFLDGSSNFYYNVAYNTYSGGVELDYFFEQIIVPSTVPTLSSYAIPTYKFKIVITQGTLIN